MKISKIKFIFNRILVFLLFSATILLLFFFLYFLFNLIYNIKDIEISGNNRYSNEEIIEKINIKSGQNLVFCDAKLAEKKIKKDLPYIENIEIKKNFPNKISLMIFESLPRFVIENNDNEFILLDFNQKILEKTNNAPENLTIIKGVKCKNIELGSKINYENKDQQKIIKEISKTALEDKFINKINLINFEEHEKIFLEHNKKIKIILGENEKIEYKVKTANEAIKKINEPGELDLCWLPKNGMTFFRPGS